MKKLLLLIICALSLLASCSKDIEIERGSYMWLKGDSLPSRNFIMSVATLYLDTVSKKYNLECQVTLGDSTDATLLGSKMQLNMNFINATDGTYNVGSSCDGDILYTTCRSNGDKVGFKTVMYKLTSGSVELQNLNAKEAKMTVNLDGIEVYKDTVSMPNANEFGDTVYVEKEVLKMATKKISLSGEMIAHY